MELNYKSFGSGPALVILHGLFGSLDNWQTLAQRYAEDFSVFIIDQRNHGKSSHSHEFSYPAMAEDLNQFLDSQGIHKTSLIGHSMGGKTVMQFAVNHEERIDKMVVADIAPVAYPPAHDAIMEALTSLPLNQILSRKEAEEWLEPRVPEFAVRKFILKSLGRVQTIELRDDTQKESEIEARNDPESKTLKELSKNPQQQFDWKFNLPAIVDNYSKILEAIHADYELDLPVLFLNGEISPYVKPAHHEAIIKMFPNARFETIEGAGHWLHADKPEQFFQISRSFLLAKG